MLEITLDKPFSPFLNLLVTTARYIVPEEEAKNGEGTFPPTLGAQGRLSSNIGFQAGNFLLEARTDYFDNLPKIKGIAYCIIPEDLTTITEFEIGNLDVITIPASSFSRFKKIKLSDFISSINGINTYYLELNCSKKPFDNPLLRKAMNYAVDREKMLRTVYEGRGKNCIRAFPDILRKWKAPASYEYNPLKPES